LRARANPASFITQEERIKTADQQRRARDEEQRAVRAAILNKPAVVM